MKYPDLVPKWVCTTPVSISIEGEGIDEDGAPAIVFNADLLCNWQDGGRTVFTDQQKIIMISGTAYFHGDIAPNLSHLTGGTALIDGEDRPREILQGFKRRNPDGTVNHTEIQFK